MLQLFLPGFPEGTVSIGGSINLLNKENRFTWFLGTDNYFSHNKDDQASFAFIVATLMRNGHVRACEFEKEPLLIPHRTLMNWGQRLRKEGPDSFFKPGRKRSGTVITDEKAAECSLLLSTGISIAEAARRSGIEDSTFRKAVTSGRISKTKSSEPQDNMSTASSTKSQRATEDATAGMGTACRRSDERIMAAIGLVESSAVARYESCQDVHMGGVLAGLPALCSNGLFSGLEKHFSLPKGFYSAMSILMTLGFMALSRIRRPEGLRHQPPGELGKAIGFDRVPEVRTLRKKISWMAEQGDPNAWMNDLSRMWMEADQEEAGYLYLDGHVRVYHGDLATLPRKYVSRERLCLRGTTDYWINDALGRPFFVVSKAVTEGFEAVLMGDILPTLLENVPAQPSNLELSADPMKHRFVMIFDREGANHKLLSALWEKRVAAITYRKSVKDKWPSNSFTETTVSLPGGNSTVMRLATRQTALTSGKKSIPVMEVRRLSDNGHQTAIITTAQQLETPVVAARMFSRWCQENYFAYMMKHYEIDGLIEYGCDELPGTTRVVNPDWRELDVKVRKARHRLRDLQAALGKIDFDDNSTIQKRAEMHQDIQAQTKVLDDLRMERKATSKKIQISDLSDQDRPNQLSPLKKTLTDSVKMIAYRAETALVNLLRPYLEKEDEARALIRELFVSSADIEPDEKSNILTIRIHRMACPAHDKAITQLLADLTSSEFKHPETGARMVFSLV